VLRPGHAELGDQKALDVLREAVLARVRAVRHIARLLGVLVV
jgi:hypothetical protein